MSVLFNEELAHVLAKYGYKAEQVMPEIEKELDKFNKLNSQGLDYHNGKLTKRAEKIFEDMRALLFLESLIRFQKNEEANDRIVFFE